MNTVAICCACLKREFAEAQYFHPVQLGPSTILNLAQKRQERDAMAQRLAEVYQAQLSKRR